MTGHLASKDHDVEAVDGPRPHRFIGGNCICGYYGNIGDRKAVHDEADLANLGSSLDGRHERPGVGELHFRQFLLLCREGYPDVGIGQQIDGSFRPAPHTRLPYPVALGIDVDAAELPETPIEFGA